MLAILGPSGAGACPRRRYPLPYPPNFLPTCPGNAHADTTMHACWRSAAHVGCGNHTRTCPAAPKPRRSRYACTCTHTGPPMCPIVSFTAALGVLQGRARC